MQTATKVSVAVLLTALGCGSRPALAPPTRAPLTPAPLAAPLTRAPVAPLPAPIAMPREIACTLVAPDWPIESVEDSEKSVHYLRFEPGQHPFAEVFSGAAATLVLPVGLASAGGILKLETKGVVLQGHIEAPEMPLYAASAFVVSGGLVPNHENRLALRSAKPGLLVVAADAGPRVHAARGELVAERACADVSFGSKGFDPGAIDTAIGAPLPPYQLRTPWPWLPTGRVELSKTPEGDPAIVIDSVEPPDDRVLIRPPRVLALQKGWTRIAIDAYGGIVFGWLPSAQLRTSSRRYLDLSHDSVSILLGPKPREGDFIACDHDVPLVAETWAERRLVGTVHKGVLIERARIDAEWTQIHFRDAGITEAENASFWVRTADLAGCGK